MTQDANLEAEYNKLRRRDSLHNRRSRPAGLGFLVFGVIIPFTLLLSGFLIGAGLLFVAVLAISLILLRSASKYSLTPEKKAFLRTFLAIQDLDSYFKEHDELLLHKVIKTAKGIPSGLTTYVGTPTTISEVLLNSVIAPSRALSVVLEKRFQLLIRSDEETLQKAAEVLRLTAHYFLNPSAQLLAEVARKADELIPSPAINETPAVPLSARIGKLPLPVVATVGSIMVGVATYVIGTDFFQLTPPQGYSDGGYVAVGVFAALIYLSTRK